MRQASDSPTTHESAAARLARLMARKAHSDQHIAAGQSMPRHYTPALVTALYEVAARMTGGTK